MHDLNQLVNLGIMGSWESRGILRPRINGDIVFNNVLFSYTTNPNVPAVYEISIRIVDGECLAICGYATHLAFDVSTPLRAAGSTYTANGSALLLRGTTVICVTKAEIAEPDLDLPQDEFLESLDAAASEPPAIWGPTSDLCQFVTMAIFVEGAWFGAHLIGEGKNSPSQVISVFWAYLIATSKLQMAVLLLIVFVTGEVTASELARMMPGAQQTFSKRHRQEPRKLRPMMFNGELTLTNASREAPYLYQSFPEACMRTRPSQQSEEADTRRTSAGAKCGRHVEFDPADQMAVLEMIRAAKVGRMMIVITHRVLVVKMCNRILVIKVDQMREQGTYECLMERKLWCLFIIVLTYPHWQSYFDALCRIHRINYDGNGWISPRRVGRSHK
ncbi:hypothetical protein AZE42_09102 [Rhizopogon vesiculosus]|uniref:Uncharacterized protein n=1 Tax=Rhizopogon vesiculosus TaxID=180088 RepID=A0A1J8QGM2_9AGAM|nr:hypothetical protein AZE42_09102 [Rhizopogon vesiculosus]